MHIFETRHRVGHSAEEMFALVAAVEDYPQFLPLCEALEVKGREFAGGKEKLIATMTVGYRLIRENFTTEVIVDKASRTAGSRVEKLKNVRWLNHANSPVRG